MTLTDRSRVDAQRLEAWEAGAAPTYRARVTGQRVVIVGAGFGGMAAAKRLSRAGVDVLVIDRNNFHTFRPLLYEVATAGLNAADVAYPVRGMAHHRPLVHFRQGDVERVDLDRRQVTVTGQAPLDYDALILAGGSTTAYFGVSGAAEHAYPLYTLADALGLRNHLLSQFEAADADPALIDAGALTFVVVGGGATGVEVSGALAEMIGHVLQRDFGDLAVTRAQVVLVEQSGTLVGTFRPRLREYTAEALRRRGVRLRLDTTVARIDAHGVTFADGTRLASRMVIWAAGVQAGDLADAAAWPRGRGGRITVGADLALAEHPEVFVIGDLADIDDGSGGRLPQLAQVAIQGGKFAAGQILHDRRGEPRDTFRYHDKGTMATIGRRAAIAQLAGRPTLTGYLAWLAWLGLHLVYLVGMRNRISVLLNWAWNYVTWNRGPRLIVTASTPSGEPPPPGEGARAG